MWGDAPACARLLLRARPGAQRALGAAFGVALPLVACRAAAQGGRAALWLGPDEWLLLAEGEDEMTLLESLAGVSDAPHSLVDVTHRQIGIALTHERAEDVLAADCPLDLDESVFPVGMCTRTVLAKAEIVLWRRGSQEWRIEVWRSFAPYVRGRLVEAAREYVS